MAIVPKHKYKYGMNTYISICFFYVRQYFDVKFTMKHFSHFWAYFSTKILPICHKCLASHPQSYFTLYKRHFEQQHKHNSGSSSHLVRYVCLAHVGSGYKIEDFTHRNKSPDNYWCVFSKESCPMLQSQSIKNTIFRGLILVLIRTRPLVPTKSLISINLVNVQIRVVLYTCIPYFWFYLQERHCVRRYCGAYSDTTDIR